MPPALEARSLNHWIAREVLESPLGLNERMVDSNSKMFEEIKISVNINILSIIKPSIFVMMVGNSTFCFLHDLRDEQGFPGGVVVKNPPATAGDMGLSPGPGRYHMPRKNKVRVLQLPNLHSRAREP